MKLATFQPRVDGDGLDRVGVVQDGEVVEVTGAETMRELFAMGPRGMELAAQANGPRTPLSEVRLRPPVTPKKFIHTAGNFREHEEESKRVDWSHAIAPWIVFFQNVDALIGDGDAVIYPDHLTSELDYEIELALVIGRDGKHFSADEAGEYIGGFTIFNDITARDIQRREMESGVFSFCKAIDTFCPLGPFITTPDEIRDPRDLAMQLRVNGEVRQDGHSGRMTPTIEEVIAHYSPLGYSAGDVVSLGTVSGVAGFSVDPQAWYLKPGDVMDASIESLGTLTNRVVAWDEAYASSSSGSDVQRTA